GASLGAGAGSCLAGPVAIGLGARLDRRYRLPNRPGAPARRAGRLDVEWRIRRHPPAAPPGVVVIPVRILSAGDSALLVEFEATIDPAINKHAIAVAAALAPPA